MVLKGAVVLEAAVIVDGLTMLVESTLPGPYTHANSSFKLCRWMSLLLLSEVFGISYFALSSLDA